MALKSKKRSKVKKLPAIIFTSTDKQGDINSSIHLDSYRITYEPFNYLQIPDEDQDEMSAILNNLIKCPDTILERIEALILKYPNIPQLYNYACAAYSNLNEPEKSRYYAEKNYQNNPDYLFAKLNYAETCMNEGNYEIIPKILDEKFKLKELYPERDLFHITEVVGFLSITGLYFARKDDTEQVIPFINQVCNNSRKRYGGGNGKKSKWNRDT